MVRYLCCQVFEIESVKIDEMFRIVHSSGNFYLSAELSKRILERNRDHLESPQAFLKALKVSH